MASSGIIQHNIMAMSSYRNYSNNTSALAKNLEKLSSALKINRAGDDAAGLAISEKMRAQITGLEVAQKNAKDGISLVQTAEGALTEVHSMLNRMVELASMSANGTYANDTDRTQLQKEMDQLSAEINRIADSANFNGIQLLDGNMDAGGDVVYTKGAFQFKAEHPAGTGNNSLLPEVKENPTKDDLGIYTILHADGTKGGESNGFAINLGNLSVVKDGAIDIKIGDNLTVTVDNQTGDTITADEIAKAIANGGSEDGKIVVTFKVDGDEVTLEDSTENPGTKTVTLGEDSVFELSASGDRVTFEQISGDAIDMPQKVTIANAEPGTTYQWQTTGNKEDDPFDSTKISVTGSGGTKNITNFDFTQGSGGSADLDGSTATVTIDGEQITISFASDPSADTSGADIVLEVGASIHGDALLADLNEKLAEIYNGRMSAEAPTDEEDTYQGIDGDVLVDNGGNGLKAGTAVDVYTYGAEEAPEEVSGEWQGDELTTDSTGVTVGNSDWGVTTFDWSIDDGALTNVASATISVEIHGETYSVTIGAGTAAGDDEHITIGTGGDIDAGTSSTKIKDLKALIEAKIKAQIKTKMGQYEDGTIQADSYKHVDVDNDAVTFDWTANGFTVKADYTEKTFVETPPEAEEDCFSGWWNASTTVLHSQSDDTQEALASTVLTLTEDMVTEGSTITIGRDTYTFTTDKTKLGKDGYVVYNEGEDVKTIAEKLTEAAKGNTTYTVGHDENGRITLTEIADQTNFDLTTMAGIEKSLGYKIATTRATDTSKGLTLQIGDTAESYNQLKVNIKDCHTKALGLDGISIANQADAAAAVDAIRDAINYVSDVRGTLGATQNRLDHTINNLSVMTENIQDAESTIRDTDIAKEMMEYTKNNIKVQAAQAMLAQANMLPQGVLQLLG